MVHIHINGYYNHVCNATFDLHVDVVCTTPTKTTVAIKITEAKCNLNAVVSHQFSVYLPLAS